jgi:hypothetical protein
MLLPGRPWIAETTAVVFSAEAAKLVFQCPAFSLAPARYDDRCAFFGKGKRRRATHAGQSAGDQHDRRTHDRLLD